MTTVDPENVLGRTRAENAACVIEEVRALGLNPNPSSRLMRMHRVLHRGNIAYGDPDFETALEAERDLAHLGIVFKQVNAHRDNPRFLKLVRDLLSDSVLPQSDLEQSTGRDAQFELYLAAISQNAGLPVDCAEPDIVCQVDGKTFGIAAKRIKSEDHHERHIKKAADQIFRSQLPGVIAIDLSLAWNRRNTPIISRWQSQMHVMILHTKARQYFDKHHEDIRRWVAGKSVLGVVVFDFHIRLRPNDHWGLDGMTMWLDTAEGKQANRDYKMLYDAFLRGIPNVTDLAADE